MGEVKEVKLYGYTHSPYCYMAQHALQLKGVAYEYVEEDLENKSEELLQLNPVYKKVPLLVVDGKPVAESRIIMEFVDEMWKDKDPPLLPEDPYKRTRVRFWADFIYKMIAPTSSPIVLSAGEAQPKAGKEFMEHLSTLEDGIEEDFPTTGPFINGEKPGLLDVMVGACHVWFKVLGEFVGVDALERMPRFCSSATAFEELEAIKGKTIQHNDMLERNLYLRGKALGSGPGP